MDTYKCANCNHFYNPERGDKKHGIPPGTPFKDIPNDWRCPGCGSDKSKYSPNKPRPFPGYGPTFEKEG
ncbi:MAG: High molecular weight rubredoxin [Syntrophus sp. PtaU1.Bin208]|nr:MAG: High molecular weight rubredoxin [Syntrophus sp. PtaU1.Bin208]